MRTLTSIPPYAVKGGCFVTGKPDGPCFDLGADLEDLPPTGAIVVSYDAIRMMAGTIGMVERERLSAAESELRAAKERIGQLVYTVDSLRTALTTIETATP